MQAKLDCVTCFQDQALRAARAAGVSEDVQKQVLRQVVKYVAGADWTATPIDLGMPVHRIVREVTGIDDPFAARKREATEAALACAPEPRERIQQAADPLRMAVRIAIAGNIIDLGALASFDLDETLEHVSTADFAIDDYERLQADLQGADSLLMFADNTGEIVFDRLLLETIAQRWSPRITLVVKSGPFINDATVADARASGLDGIQNLRMREISNGDEGDAPDYASREIDEWIAEHDVLLMAKCPCVADAIGVNVGDVILQHSSSRGGER
ncbi:MAG: damage-control phosphatase ARMT1 family protein [Armatimonadota bacterium]